jgi:hypothetical protein
MERFMESATKELTRKHGVTLRKIVLDGGLLLLFLATASWLTVR